MPSAIDKVQKDRAYLGEGRRHCLPGSSIVGGTVVDDVVDHRGNCIGRRDYRTIKEGRRNNKYKARTTNNYITRKKKSYRCFNIVRCTLLGAGNHLGMKYRLRVITG